MAIDTANADAATWVRAAREHRRLSQRELAAMAGVPRSTVDRIESRRTDPRFATVLLLLGASGHHLLVRDHRGLPIAADPQLSELRDHAGRQFPAHLDYGRVAGPWQFDKRQWWRWDHDWPTGDEWVPEWTFWRSRRHLDRLRLCVLDHREMNRPYDDAT